MKLSKMFLTKKFFTLLALLFFSIAAFSQTATVDLTPHKPTTLPSGSVFEWHSSTSPSPADLLSLTAITAATTSTVYGVFYDTTSDCYSPAAKVDVKISDCGATTVNLTTYQTDFTATLFEWYTESAGTAKVGTPSAVTGGTYFLFDNNGGTLTRLNQVVIVSINPTPSAPTTGAPQIVCETSPIQTLTASATSIGNTITWYANPTGGATVNPTLSTTGSITYYAESSNGICSSTSRTAVVLTINAAPAKPTAGLDVIVCATGTSQTLTATATVPSLSTIDWYDASTGGNIVSPATLVSTIAATKTLYGQTSDGTCSSLDRTAVVLTINAAPAKPTAGLDVIVCATGTSQTLTATATVPTLSTIVWYDAATGGNIVSPATLVSTIAATKTLYGQTSNGTCSSLDRTAVVLTINATPAQPTLGAVTQALCDPFDNSRGSFQITNFNDIYTYSVSPSGTVGGAGLVSVDPGTTSATFTVTATLGSCSSIASLSSGSLNPEMPQTTPVIDNLVASTCYYGTATFQIKSYNTTLYNYKVISSPIGAVSSIDIAGKVTVQNGYSYSVQHQYVGGTCWSGGSNAFSVNSAYYSDPPLSATSVKNVCPVLTVNLSALFTGTVPPGNTLVWYDNNTVPPTGTAVTDPTKAPTGPKYYAFYKNDTNSCFASAPSTGIQATASDACCPAGYVAPIIH